MLMFVASALIVFVIVLNKEIVCVKGIGCKLNSIMYYEFHFGHIS